MSLQSAVDSLPARITEAVKNLFTARDTQLAEFTQVQADLATARQTIATLTTQRDEAVALHATTAAELAAEKAKVAEFDAKVAAAVTEKLEAASTKKAAEITASVGVPPLPIKPQAAIETKDIRQQFAAMKPGPERSAFYRKHRNQLR